MCELNLKLVHLETVLCQYWQLVALSFTYGLQTKGG